MSTEDQVDVEMEFDEEAIRREMEAMLAESHARERAAHANAPAPGKIPENGYSQVKHIIGVVSGKGGVGKSLVCGMLAVQLARQGKTVGILDADITGPSIPRMFGLAGAQLEAMDNFILPARSGLGIRIVSMNLALENESDPVVWRGPVLAGVINQFWSETAWGQLDYLLVDMPPGTGDVPLTVFQSLPVDGIVIVSSPQDLVQMVVGKAVRMANMMDIPVLGIVENMAYFACPHCGEHTYPFGESHLEETCAGFGVDALDRLPIDPTIALAADEGRFEEAVPADALPEALRTVETYTAYIDAVIALNKEE